jgi:DNA-binding CsgD family transcriptional regulator
MGPTVRRPSEGKLTQQQQKITELACQGLSNGQIGDLIGCASGTVKSHIANIYRKTGATSRAELVMIYTGKILIKTDAQIVQLLTDMRAEHAARTFNRASAGHYQNVGALWVLDQLIEKIGALDPDRKPGPPMTDDERERQARIREFARSHQEEDT